MNDITTKAERFLVQTAWRGVESEVENEHRNASGTQGVEAVAVYRQPNISSSAKCTYMHACIHCHVD